MLTSGFYNGRYYDAIQFSRLFEGIIKDGVFMAIKEQLLVKENQKMTVSVNPGRAWFNNSWIDNDADYLLTLDQSDLLYKRIDAIVVETNSNEDVLENTIKIVKGIPAGDAQKPELIRSERVNQYPLCYITINKEVEEVKQADIENMVGTEACPFITGILDTIHTDDLLLQWEAQFQDWMDQNEEENTAWIEKEQKNYKDFLKMATQEFLAYQLSNENDFTIWFNNIKATLDENAAGKLQNQIDENAEIEFKHFYGLFSRVTTINYDVYNRVSSIVSASDEASTTTTFEEMNGIKTIKMVVNPLKEPESHWIYTATTTFKKQDGKTIITESYTKAGKPLLED